MSEIEVVVQPTIVEVTAGQFVPVPGPIGPEGPPGVGGEDVTARLDGIDAALAAETTERTSADGALSGRIDALETAVPNKADAAAVAAIDTRLTAAETTLNAVADDIDLLEAADTDIATTVDAIDTRVGTIETALPGLATDTELATAVSAEATARASADNALDTRLSVAESALLDTVRDDDPRLSDARTPTPHGHEIGEVDGLITALADRPTQDEADLRYRALATEVPWLEVGGKPTAFPPEYHEHSILDVSGLEAALNERPTGAQTDAVYRSKFEFVPWDEIANAPDFAPAAAGVPAGGTAGQVLTKTAATDYAAAWSDPAAASGLPEGGADGDMLRKSTGTTAIWESIATLAGRVVTALNGLLTLNGASGTTRGTVIQTGGVARWSRVTTDAETGANAGSNEEERRHADNGSVLGNLWRRIRATGQAIFDGLEILLLTGDLRLAAGTITVSVGNIILSAGRLELNSNASEIRFGNGSSASNYADLRSGTSTLGMRVHPNGVRPRGTGTLETWFYDDGGASLFTSSAAVSLTATVMGNLWLILSGAGGSTSIAINNPTNAPLNGNASSGRFTVKIENRGSGNAATPTFGNQWDTRAWGAALAPGQYRRADFEYLASTQGTRRYFQITDWQAFNFTP